jgi:acetylglutamate kinase
MTVSQITVVKLGGSTLGRHDTSLDDIAALYAEGQRFVVVHGGGATISEWLARHGVESRFVRGLRATDAAALDIVVAVLAGLVNKRLVAELLARGANAIGLSGVDGAVLRARRYDPALGFVGEITGVDAEALAGAAEHAVVVLAPIAIETNGEPALSKAEGSLGPQLLNLNADTAAGEVATALGAERLVFLTDVPGVMDAAGKVQATIGPKQAKELLASGAVDGGMIPKVEAGLRAAMAGVQTVVVDGRQQGALRAVLSGHGAGTRIG